MSTTICHWNIRGFRGNYSHLRQLLSDSQSVVVCLQETMLPAIAPDPPSGFLMFNVSGPQSAGVVNHGGVCTLVKNNIGHRQIDLNTTLQAVAIRVQLDKLYTVCNLYLPPNSPVNLQELEDLIDQLPSPYLLVGDLNARHPLWGDCTTNQKGRLIETLLTNSTCSILNAHKPTHFHAQTDTFSCIDLSLCSANIASVFTWDVMLDLYTSDHFPVLLSLPNTECRQTEPRYLLENADWRGFRDLAVCDRDMHSFPSIPEALSYFVQTVLQAAEDSIPKTSNRDVFLGGIRIFRLQSWNTKERQKSFTDLD